MGWSDLGKAASSASGNGGRYLKLSDGSRYELLLLSEPYQKDVTWPDGRQSVRFAAVVYCTDDPSGAQQFEFGAGVAKDLALELKGQDPATTKVMVSRKGSGKTDTRYTVARLGKASADELRAARAADADRTWDLQEDGWYPLEGSGEPVPKASPDPDPHNAGPDEDIPF
jgi:hypothetical protein